MIGVFQVLRPVPGVPGDVRHLRVERPGERPRLREGFRLAVPLQHPQLPAQHVAHDAHERGELFFRLKAQTTERTQRRTSNRN